MKRLMSWLLRRRGWRFEGEIPDLPRIVAVGAPHTSNLDFFVFLAALHEYQVRVSFIGKHTLFRWPLGMLMRRWGGIPVDRRRPEGLVDQVTSAIEAAPRTLLVIAPEGTRQETTHWKDGFLRIAQASHSAIVLVGLDGADKRVVIGPVIDDLSDRTAVMDQARDFYSKMGGLRPDKVGPIRLADERSGLLG